MVLHPPPKPDPSADGHRAGNTLLTALLRRGILFPILDIRDPSTDHRITFVRGGYDSDAVELEQIVENGSVTVAYKLLPVNNDEVMRVADSYEVMSRQNRRPLIQSLYSDFLFTTSKTHVYTLITDLLVGRAMLRV